MASFGIWDTFFVYQFVKRLVKPFDKWEAYKTGVIDKSGNIVVPYDDRNEEQRKSFRYFDLLVLNLKKVLAKIPGGSTKIATYAAAIWLLREDVNKFNLETLEEDFITFLKEDIANTANPAHIAGLDNPPKFMNHKVYNVKMSTLMKIRHGKKPKDRYAKYLDEEENAEEIRQYCRSNPNESVILQHQPSGQMMFLRRKSQRN
jgi:hypothetical protein